MPNIKISDLPPIAGGFDPDAVFLEVQETVAGELVSRKISVTEVTAGAGPLAATYVTVTANAILPNERILTAGADIDIVDGGAGGNITISLTAGASYFQLTATGRVIGSDAGSSNTGDNVILGGSLAGDLNIADGVIALGQNALAAAVQLDFAGSIAIGRNAGALLGDTRDPWIIIGDGAAANIQPRSFHDANTIIGTNALGALAATATVQQVTIIGHDAVSDMTGASGLGVINNAVVVGSDAGIGTVDASIASTVIIGARACSDLRAGGVTSSVIIGNAAGESLGGATLDILIGAGAAPNLTNADNCIVIGCNTFGFSGTTDNQIIIGHGSMGNAVIGETNIFIGNSMASDGTERDFDHCIIIGHLSGNNMIGDQDIFAIEQPQSNTSNLARPFLFGNMLNGNLALLNIEAMTGGSETGTRIVPAWADAAPVAGQGVFSMYGAGTDLAATTDADFVHFWIRASDTAYMLQYPLGDTISILHDGTDSIIANSAGAMQLSGTGAVIFNSNSVEGLRLTEDNSGVLQVPSAAVTITAFAGGGQGSAVALIHSYNVITVVATAGDSVRLPDVFAVNSLVYVKNDDAAEAADVFPASGDNLGAGVDTAVSLAAGSSLTFIATVADSTWTQLIDPQVGGSAVAGEFNNLLLSQTPGSHAASPTLRFGDGDTGFYEALDDEINTSIAGTSVVRQNSLFIFATVVGSFGIRTNIPASSIVPTFFPNNTDNDTGIGWTSSDRGALVAGGNLVADFVEIGGNTQLIFPLQNNAAAPSLAFGDGDSGFYENADDFISVALAGVRSFAFGATVFQGIVAGSGALRNEAASAINPTFNPNGSDASTGIGQNSTGEVSIITTGVESLRFTAGSGSQTGGTLQSPSADLAITAFAGGGQGSATVIKHSYNVVTVVATAGDSVQLPSTFAADSIIYIKNDDASEAADVFPAAGDDLGAGVNTAVSLAAGDSLTFIATVADSTWTQLIVAAGAALDPFLAVSLTLSETPGAHQAQPTLAFGDGDTGFFENADDSLRVSLGGTRLLTFLAASMNFENGPQIQNESTSATNPVFIPRASDIDSGLGSNAADSLSLIAGGVEIARLTEAAEDQFIVSPGALLGSGALPALAFGDGDTGFFELADDVLDISIAGSARFFITSGAISGRVTGSSALANILASGTTPSLLPDQSDTNTGIGQAAADQLSLIAGGLEMLRLVETGVSTTDQLIIGPAGIIGAAATPALAFGDGNTGLFESADNELSFSTGGARRIFIDANGITSNSTNGFQLNNDSPSSTDPNVIPRRTDDDTGYSWSEDDTAAIVSGGVAALELKELNSNVIQVPDAQIGLTAFATGGQGSATQVNASYAVFSTVATLDDSGKLPPVFKANSVITVKNDGAADMAFFPASGDDLGAGTDTAVTIIAGESAKFIATVANATWTQLAPIVAV